MITQISNTEPRYDASDNASDDASDNASDSTSNTTFDSIGGGANVASSVGNADRSNVIHLASHEPGHDVSSAAGTTPLPIIRQFEGDLAMPASRLDDPTWLLNQLVAAIDIWDLHLLKTDVEKFEPIGVTAIAILEESHAAVHTWPEWGYAHFSMVTCGGRPELAQVKIGLERSFECTVPRLQELGYPVRYLAA